MISFGIVCRHLDISQADDTTMFLPLHYQLPEDTFKALLAHLPHLRSLDLSGTNLAGYLSATELSYKPSPKSFTETEKYVSRIVSLA